MGHRTSVFQSDMAPHFVLSILCFLCSEKGSQVPELEGKPDFLSLTELYDIMRARLVAEGATEGAKSSAFPTYRHMLSQQLHS